MNINLKLNSIPEFEFIKMLNISFENNKNIIDQEMSELIKLIINFFINNGLDSHFKFVVNKLVSDNCVIDKETLAYIDKHLLNSLFQIVKGTEFVKTYSFNSVMKLVWLGSLVGKTIT